MWKNLPRILLGASVGAVIGASVAASSDDWFMASVLAGAAFVMALAYAVLFWGKL